ncbi:MAG: hypothetical protein ACI4OT_00060 [Bacilli bacterium]
MMKYVFDRDDEILFDKLLNTSNKIIDIYNKLSIMEQENNYLEFDNYKERLLQLKTEEENIYNEIYKKENRGRAFRDLVCKKGDLNLNKEDDYKNIKDISSNLSYKRIKSILDLELDKKKMEERVERLTNNASVISNIPIPVPKEFLERIVRETEMSYYRLYNTYYFDVFNSFLVYLDSEINNRININIREDLINVKYNLISSNISLEDKYLKNDYKIGEVYYKGINIIYDMYNMPNKIKDLANKELFKDAIIDCTKNALVLGDFPFDSNNYKNILLNVIMVESILAVTDDNNLLNEVNNIIESFQTKIKSNNIANFLLGDLTNSDNNYNNKIINMTLRQN